MAQVNTSDVYPSLVNLTTNDQGDLNEVIGSPSSKASLDIYAGDPATKVSLEAVDAGAAGNNLSITVLDNQGGSDRADYDANTGEIVVSFRDAIVAAFGGTASSAVYNGSFSITAKNIGVYGDDIQFSVVDNVAGAVANEVKVNATDGDIAVCLFDDIASGNGGAGYTNQDIHDLITDSLAIWKPALDAVVDIGSVTAGTESNQAVNSQFSLAGGAEPSGQNPSNGIQAVVNLINNTAETSAVVVASGGNTDVPTTVAKTNLSGGADLVASDLDFNSSYLCLKVSDVHSLLDSEVGDARKIVWGMLETYVQHVTGQSAEQQPENFITSRGNPTLVIDQAGTRLRQTYTINAFYEVGDLDLEDETGV